MKTSHRIDPRRLLAFPGFYRKFRQAVAGNAATRLVGDFLKIDSRHRVLDIGCGTADILDQLPQGIDYHGYDIEPAYITSALERYGHRGSCVIRSVSPEAVEGLGTFDVVIALGVLPSPQRSTGRYVIRNRRQGITLGRAPRDCRPSAIVGQQPAVWCVLAGSVAVGTYRTE